MLSVAQFFSPLFVFNHSFRRSYLMSLVTRHPSPVTIHLQHAVIPQSSGQIPLLFTPPIRYHSWCLFFSRQLSPVSKFLLSFRYLRLQKIIICTLYNQNVESLRLITQLIYDAASWCVYARVDLHSNQYILLM